MEFLIELLLELILEGSLNLSTNRKVPSFIRYFLIGIISLFFISVILLIFLVGILFLKESLIGGILMIIIGIVLFIACLLKFKKIYLSKIK